MWIKATTNGPNAASAAKANGIELIVIKLPEAKKGFVLLPRCALVVSCTGFGTVLGGATTWNGRKDCSWHGPGTVSTIILCDRK